MTGYIPNSVYSTLSFIGFIFTVATLAPTPWAWYRKLSNTGTRTSTTIFILWTALGALIQFVNSILWNNNTINKAPIWCDISVHLMTGYSIGIPAAGLCISFRLYRILRQQSQPEVLISTKSNRRLTLLTDLSVSLGIPALAIIFQPIVSDRRFDVYEDVGCVPALSNTPLSYVLNFAWPLVIGVVTAVYGVLIAYKCKSKWTEVTPHYQRLFGLILFESIFAIILGSLGIAAKAPHITPWTTYSQIHANWFDVEQVPTSEWRDTGLAAVEVEMERWFIILCAFVLFALVFIPSRAHNSGPPLPVHNEPKSQSRHAVMTTFTPSSDSTLGEKIDSCDRAEVTSEIGSLPPTPMSPAHFQSSGAQQSRHAVMTTFAHSSSDSTLGDMAEIGSLPPTPRSPDSAPFTPMSPTFLERERNGWCDTGTLKPHWSSVV